MERAISESNRRRSVQLEYNKEHNITPVGVTTKVLDVMEGAYASSTNRVRRRDKGPAEKGGAFTRIDLNDPVAVTKEIGLLESKMYELAKNLEFEEAADTRDKIAQLKNQLLKQ